MSNRFIKVEPNHIVQLDWIKSIRCCDTHCVVTIANTKQSSESAVARPSFGGTNNQNNDKEIYVNKQTYPDIYQNLAKMCE
jgi:hypothetical protein